MFVIKVFVLVFYMYLFYPPRGAAGRLMRLEDTQTLLDDFGIPLQVSPSSNSRENPAPIHVCWLKTNYCMIVL